MDKYINNRSTCNRTSSNNIRRDSTASFSQCAALKSRLQQLEFAIDEVVLYLDAYPECSKALDYYHRLIDERNQIVTVINTQCGPMTHLDNVSTDTWQWINGPWPWKYEAN